MVGRTKKIKFKILTTLLMALAIMLSPLATLVNNISVAYAENETVNNVEGDTLELVGFKSEVKFNTEYILPKINDGGTLKSYGDLIDDENYSYKVFQNVPKRELTSTSGEENKTAGIHESNGEWVFIALTTGTYTLEITKKVGDKILTAIQNQTYGNKKSNGLTVNVISENYSIALPTNSEYVVPAKMPLLDGAERLEVAIPRPTVLSNKGEEINELDYAKLEVRVNGELLEAEENGTYLFTPDNIGTYQISYIYRVSGKVLGSRYQKFEVVPKESFKLDDLKLRVEFTGAIEERMTLGVETELPGAYAVDQNGERINAYIEITAEHISATNEPTNCNHEINQKDFTITPTLIGNYWIYYQAKHPLFNIESEKFQPTNNSDSKHRVEVVDEELPEILLVNDYEIDQETNTITSVNGVDVEGKEESAILDLMGDLSATVPSIVIIPNGETSVVIDDFLPAIYAKDNFTTGYDNFEFSRKVRDGGSTKDLFVLDGEGENTDEIYANNEKASFKFLAPTGTTRRYTFIYTAKDKKYGIPQELNFHVNVLTQEVYERDYETQPTLEFTVDKDEIYADGTLTFAKPIVTDENIDYKDRNIDVDIVVKVIGLNGEKNLTGAELEAMFNDKTKLYEVDFAAIVAEVGEVQTATVTAYARNDYYKQIVYPTFDAVDNLPSEDQLPPHVVQEITVLPIGDKDAPVFAFVGADNLGDALYTANEDEILKNYPELNWNYLDNGHIQIDGQEKAIFFPRNVITLPAVSVTDADKNVKYSIHIFNGGKRVYLDVANPTQDNYYDAENDLYILTIAGAKFEASVSGLYEVIFQFEDGLGNITTKTFGIVVGEPNEPAMVITSFPKTAELGKEFVYPKITLSDGTIIDSKDWTITLTAPNGYLNFGASASGFTPNVEGEYKIEYKWGGHSEHETTYFILNVSDTIAPVINTFYQYGHFEEIDFDNEIKWDEEDTTLRVYLPMYTVTDENNNLEETLAKVTVRNKAGSIITTHTDIENACHYFELKDHKTNQGVYSVEYTAVDKANNQAVQSAEHKINLYIGNCNNPNVIWEDKAIPTTMELGEEWILPIDKMTIVDLDAETLGDTHESLMELFKTKSGTVKLTGPNGEVIDNVYDEGEPGVWGWIFDQTGDYRLSLVVYDNANNTWEQSYIITVPTHNADEDINISNTVGTILIILSIAVLSGVVIYFLFSNKRLAKIDSRDSKK